jgi:hypothetical protein
MTRNEWTGPTSRFDPVAFLTALIGIAAAAFLATSL